VLEREGYAVAAGSALGFVALGELHSIRNITCCILEVACLHKVTKEFLIGHGSDAFGFMDTFLDRLFEYIGSKEVYHVRFFFS
jgi:anaphase-promoting complex subunit 1